MLKEKIEQERTKLYNLLDKGMDDELVKFSQELDLLINEYNSKKYGIQKNSK